MRLWRISNYADLTGTGAREFAGRWNMGGLPMVYLADHPSTALLETIVHFDREILPRTYQLLAIDAIGTPSVGTTELPDDWRENTISTRKIGQNFLQMREYVLLRVPSVIMPQAFNYLLNPAHPDAPDFNIGQSWRHPFDSRLLT
jgi:RES domain-containing protein